ncbi:uncharacterized protein LOC116267471 [Nymphaea colorata]|uniref:uncharacterized protein LOC116267471 n=1 Tax=Nymphaea colorata TaxID=210225 RepID=UPI00129DD0C5|nr:uncharacterized protein LOC116267471 [Nymphaea colorata]
MARSLLKCMSMSGRFWGEAVRHAVYLLNHLPTKAMGECTPYEAWSVQKPDLAHLRLFGCTVHARVTTPHLKKLDDCSQPMVHLGIEDGCKAHRLFDPRCGRIHVSHDAKFEEKLKWNWNMDAGGNESSNFTIEDESNTELAVDNSVASGQAGRLLSMELGYPAYSSTSMGGEATLVATPARRLLAVETTTALEMEDSNDGPVRYRHIDDIMRDARCVELDDEDVEEEAMLATTEESSYYRRAISQPAWEEAMAREIESIEKNST